MLTTLNITDDSILTALRGFLLSILPSEVEVIRAQGNKVAMPIGEFVVMTPINMTGLSTNVVDYDRANHTRKDKRSSQVRIQIDCFGDSAFEMATKIFILSRNEVGCDYFLSSGIDMQPLYADDPKQTNLINGEKQYENRWTLEFYAQVNPVVTTPQDFAEVLHVGIKEVDTTYQ